MMDDALPPPATFSLRDAIGDRTTTWAYKLLSPMNPELFHQPAADFVRQGMTHNIYKNPYPGYPIVEPGTNAVEISQLIQVNWRNGKKIFEIDAPVCLHNLVPNTIKFTKPADAKNNIPPLSYILEYMMYERTATAHVPDTMYAGYFVPTSADRGITPRVEEVLIESFTKTATDAGFETLRCVRGTTRLHKAPDLKFWFNLRPKEPEYDYAKILYKFGEIMGPSGSLIQVTFKMDVSAMTRPTLNPSHQPTRAQPSTGFQEEVRLAPLHEVLRTQGGVLPGLRWKAPLQQGRQIDGRRQSHQARPRPGRCRGCLRVGSARQPIPSDPAPPAPRDPRDRRRPKPRHLMGIRGRHRRRRRVRGRGWGPQDAPPPWSALAHTVWIRDLHEEGIEPHPGPSALSKNIDGLTARFSEVMHRISTRHKSAPIQVVLLQEHHLTSSRADFLRVTQVARNLGLFYAQAHRPVNEAKGGAAIVIPLDMIERKPGESKVEAIRRVEASVYRSPDGRVVTATTMINGESVTMASIYAPVDPAARPTFFTAIKPRFTAANGPHLIGMDANCIFDTRLDVSRPGPPDPDDTKGRAELRDLLIAADTTDITRETMGDASYYTNHTVLQGRVQMTRKRIDHIHTPTIDSVIWTFRPHTPDFLKYQQNGHELIEATFNIVKEKRGRDLPFINEAVYDDPTFNAEIVAAIKTTMDAATDGHYGEKWEETKDKVRDMSLERTDQIRKAKDDEAERLRDLITVHKAIMQGDSSPANASTAAEIAEMEKQLREHRKNRRSMHDMLEKEAYTNGQKHDISSAAFHRQWTPKNSAQWVEELIIRDWSDPSNPQQAPDGPQTETRHDHIAEAFTAYYDPLYEEKPPKKTGTAQDGSPNNPFKEAIDTLRTGNRVLPPTAARCGAPITTDEVEHTSAYLPLGKSPGPDRIPNKFYRVFARVVSPILTKVYNESKEHGHLPDTLNQGIISVMYKKKSREDPRNYRPITLLNNDYKILMRILTARMNEAVVQFVSKDQNGFVPDGFIAENIMRLQLIQYIIETENMEAVFIFLDMEKAFDRCSWEFLLEGLSAVGFDDSFIDYVKLV